MNLVALVLWGLVTKVISRNILYKSLKPSIIITIPHYVDAWEPLTTIQLSGCIAEVGFCKKRDILSANNSTTVYILKQHVMSTHYNQEMAVVQVSAHELSISSPATGLLNFIIL